MWNVEVYCARSIGYLSHLIYFMYKIENYFFEQSFFEQPFFDDYNKLLGK
jgi:hypothetical protein